MRSMDLVEFLNARLDEDERDAKTMADHYPPPWDLADRGWMARVVADEPNCREVTRLEQWPGMPTAEGPTLGEIIRHIARHDPARVLADVAAKRRILADYRKLASAPGSIGADLTDGAREGELENVTQLLAQVYADHPDYRGEWAL